MQSIYIITILLITLNLPLWAFAETISVDSIQVQPGLEVALSITIDTPENIAGATFTINHSEYLSLTNIETHFFSSFDEQWNTITPTPEPLPPNEVVTENELHTQPFVFTYVNGKIFVAAARILTGSHEQTLFTLHFHVAEDTPDGIYPVTISPTTVSSTFYGYASQGSLIPMLVGYLPEEVDVSKAYPAILPAVVNGSITVNSEVVDSDNDGIADWWENEYFGNLTTANSTSDFDGDGYSDLQEYLNQMAGVQDSASAVFDPTLKNEPGGVGFNPRDDTNFWILMMPVLMHSNK